jgi:hypothetical protein
MARFVGFLASARSARAMAREYRARARDAAKATSRKDTTYGCFCAQSERGYLERAALEDRLADEWEAMAEQLRATISQEGD